MSEAAKAAFFRFYYPMIGLSPAGGGHENAEQPA